MAEGAYGKLGLARTYALIFGIAYIGVAVLEIVFRFGSASHAWVIGSGGSINNVILFFKPVHNLIHWATGIAVLGSFFAGDSAAKAVARVVGVVFLVVTLLGWVAGGFTMQLLGYGKGLSVPWSYEFIHLATAIGALYSGFAGSRAGARTGSAA